MAPHGVAAAAHRHVEREGVVEGLQRGDLPRSDVALDEVHHAGGGLPREGVPLLRLGERRAVVG